MHHNDKMRLKRPKTHAGAKIAKRKCIYTPKSKSASDGLLMRVERTEQIITTMRTMHAQISGTRSDVQVEELLAIRTELLLFRFRNWQVPKMGTWFFYDAGDAGQTKTGNCHLLQNGYKMHKTRSFYA